MMSCREVTRMIASDQLAGAGWRTRLAVRIIARSEGEEDVDRERVET